MRKNPNKLSKFGKSRKTEIFQKKKFEKTITSKKETF